MADAIAAGPPSGRHLGRGAVTDGHPRVPGQGDPRRYGVPVPRGGVAYSPEQATYRAKEIGGSAWVVKAQVHSGGRGEAGGVKLCTHRPRGGARSPNSMFGRTLVTQPDRPEPASSSTGSTSRRPRDIARELYFGFVLDRGTERIMVVASARRRHGDRGARRARPEASLRASASIPPSGLPSSRPASSPSRSTLEPAGAAGGARLPARCYRAFRDLDATMVEINPLVITEDGDAGRARRQDALRRQRALPPPGDRRAARPQPGGPAREPTPRTAGWPTSGSTATSAA